MEEWYIPQRECYVAMRELYIAKHNDLSLSVNDISLYLTQKWNNSCFDQWGIEHKEFRKMKFQFIVLHDLQQSENLQFFFP